MRLPIYHLVLLSGMALIIQSTTLFAQQQEEASPVESLDLIKQGRSAYLASEHDSPYDQLLLIEKQRDGEIRARKDVSWQHYTDIILQPATVEFRDNWLRDQNRFDRFKVSRSDMRKIEKTVAEQFQVVVASQLEKDGAYAVNTSAGEQAISIKPRIVDLNVAAPETSRASSSRQLTPSSTKMTVILELYDSKSGVLLATTKDRIEDPYLGTLQAASSTTNKADIQRLLKQWATDLDRKLHKTSNSPIAGKSTQTGQALN